MNCRDKKEQKYVQNAKGNNRREQKVEITKLSALTEVLRTEAGSGIAIVLTPLGHDVAA